MVGLYIISSYLARVLANGMCVFGKIIQESLLIDYFWINFLGARYETYFINNPDKSGF